MKKRVLLTLICALSVMMVMAQNRTNPDVADYYIKGNLSIERGIDGKPVYKLSVIDNQGIYFENPRATRVGEETSFEDVLFQFSRASTDYSGGINTPLDFWRYDDVIHEWQPDGETRQGTAGVETKKSMVVMLVLDCSSSIGVDFVKVQEHAKAFIQTLYNASDEIGNIKLGIISFSKINETQIFNIRPLTFDSYNETTRFINSLSIQNGTALYYALDKSVELMEDYCKNSISLSEPLSSAVMVTFTDGLDQTSRDPDKDILTADNYYDKVLSKYGTKMQKVSINGISLRHEICGVKGNDIITEAQYGKFERISESLGNFREVKDYSELGAAFADIAQNLIDQWRVLKLYVPNSFSGRVAWTYPSRKQVVVKKSREPRKKGRLFFGLNVGVGLSNYSEYLFNTQSWYDRSNVALTGGIDLAFPIGKWINLGAYVSGGYDFAGWSAIIEAGPLMLINFNKGGAIYLGGGYAHAFEYGGGFDVRLGYKFRNGLYLFGDYIIVGGTNNGHGKIPSGSIKLINIGYSF